MSVDNFKSQNRGGKGIKGMQTIEEDYIEDLLMTTNHHYIDVYKRQLKSSFRRHTSMWASTSWTAMLCGSWCPLSMWMHRTNPVESGYSTSTSSTTGWASSR